MAVLGFMVFGLQLITVAQVFSLHRTHSGELHKDLRKALMAQAGILIPSLVMRVASSVMWQFGAYKDKRLHETYGGRTALLLTTAISTYATAVAAGAVMKDSTVIAKTHGVDSNLDVIVVMNMITLVLALAETAFSHTVHNARTGPTPPSIRKMPQVLIIVAVVGVLFLLQLVTLAAQILVFASIAKAEVQPDLTIVRKAMANELLAAAAAGQYISLATLAFTFAYLGCYALKGFVAAVDETFAGKSFLFLLSAGVWLTASLSYGSVVPGASVFSLYEDSCADLLVLPNKFVTVTSVVVLASLSFWMQFVAVVGVHVAAFLRVRGQEQLLTWPAEEAVTKAQLEPSSTPVAAQTVPGRAAAAVDSAAAAGNADGGNASGAGSDAEGGANGAGVVAGSVTTT
jgi:hypothetical protein